jgi:hypothetical protein
MTSTNQSSIDEILEELYRAGTHKMYCTEPHHLRSIAETERQIESLITERLIEELESCLTLFVDEPTYQFVSSINSRISTLKANLRGDTSNE